MLAFGTKHTDADGLHPLILALEPPELRATAATVPGGAKQRAIGQWGQRRNQAQQAPEARETSGDEPTEAAADSHESQDGSAAAPDALDALVQE
eukprot:3719270-Prymnesium_polylepis.1